MKGRTPVQQAWYWHYQMFRLNNPELQKVLRDKILFGTGFYKLDSPKPGFISRVPLQSVRIL